MLGHPEWRDDPRFRTNTDRMANLEELVRLMNGVLFTRTRAEWMELFDAAGIPAGPVHSIGEALTHPQTLARGMVVETQHTAAFFGTGQGGSTQANVDRWIAQFKPEKGSAGPGKPVSMKVGAIPVTIVTTEGTYSSGMPGGPSTPKPGWALRGGIAEGPQGPVFFKMYGPKKTVLGATAAFDGLLKTLKKG